MNHGNPHARRALTAVVLCAICASLGVHAQETAKPADSEAPVSPTTLKAKGRVRLLGAEVPPGTVKRLTWNSTAIEGFVEPVPVVVLNGKGAGPVLDRKSTRLNSSHLGISYA